jgi:uncharacterized protein YjaG (DUF416 family)
MALKIFDEVSLKMNLEMLDRWGRVAFAAACSERLFPLYVEFSRTAPAKLVDVKTYSSALDHVWNCLALKDSKENITKALLTKCEKLLPSEEDAWEHGCPYSEDAAASIVFCLRLLLYGDSQEAFWTARRLYEVVDHFVVNSLGCDLCGPEDELLVRESPIVQKELDRQFRDLTDSRAAARTSAAFNELCLVLRNRSKIEASVLFER